MSPSPKPRPTRCAAKCSPARRQSQPDAHPAPLAMTADTPPSADLRKADGPLHGLSFQQLLLLAFLLIAGLLGVSSLRALYTLEQLMVQSRLGADQASQWRAHLDAVKALLDAPPERALENEQRVAEEFVTLEALHTTIVQSVQEINAQRNRALQDRVKASRRNVTHQVVGVIVLALVLALALGIWLARPFKRLEGTIRRLGENQLEAPVVISGPDDVRRVGKQLEWLCLRLLELDSDKARFLSHVSHELKTPLAAQRDGVALLQDGVTGELNAGQREVTQILHHNTLVLQGEIEALLRFNAAAFEARQLQRRDTDLLALLEAQV